MMAQNMTHDEAIARIGPQQDAGAVVEEANRVREDVVPGSRFFGGRTTTWGFVRDDEDPGVSGADLERRCEAVELARGLAEEAERLGVYLSSESDEAYEPLVVALGPGTDFVERVRVALALGAGELVKDDTVGPAEKFLFFKRDELDYARDYLADEHGLTDPDDDAVLGAIGMREDQSSFTPEEADAYRRLVARMAVELEHLHQLSFDWDQQPELYAVSPVMFVGERHGYAVGLWANRVWT